MYLLTFLLALWGFATLGVLVYFLVGLQSKMLETCSFDCLGYKWSLVSNKKKDLTFKIEKKPT